MKEGAKILVYGEPGVGKTVLLGTAVNCPATFPILYLDCEGGTRSIRSKCNYLESVADLGNPIEGKIDVLRVRDWSTVVDAYEFLFDNKYKTRRSTYKAVAIDTMTELVETAMSYVMRDELPKKREDPGVPEQRDYLKTTKFVKDFIRGLRDIEELHVLFTCQPLLRENKETTIMQVVPEFVGNRVTNAVRALVDYGGYMSFDAKRNRVISFQQEGRVWAKWRVDEESAPEAVARITEPTITKIMELVENTK